ncbi:MAG: NUDIX domain-containing protein [Patescibacteria group bacterium]
MKYKIAVKGIIKREGGEILIVKRSEKDLLLPAIWETIGGGMDENDLTPQEALKREILEEVGLEVRVREPFNIFTFTNNEGEMKVGITFICDYLSGKVTLSEEHSEFAWINPSNFYKQESIESLHREIANYASKFSDEHEKFSISQKVVLIRDNKCFIAKLSNRLDGWDLPGGRINVGEDKEEGLRREVREELGIDNFELLSTIDYDAWHTSTGFAVCGTTTFITSDEEITLSDEHSEFKWISEDEIDDFTFLWPSMKDSIKKGFELSRK